jgi:serine/threonine-protein kinase
MISGKGDAEDIVKAMKIGADNYITKPFELEQVEKVIRELVVKKKTSETAKKVEKSMQSIGDYSLIKQIGSGGMSVVYRARQVSTGRTVALKVIFPNLIKEDVSFKRFLREARFIGELDHPNIIKGIDVGRIGENCFLVMEYIEGKSLDALIYDKGPFENEYAVHVMLQIFAALKYIHSKNVIHRDIKPSNVLISNDNVVKLIDLGLTKHIDSHQNVTEPGYAAGTAGYMPPEAIYEDEPLDPRSDIYSAGATIYYMMTGEQPFHGNSYEIFRKQKTHVPSVKSINDYVSREFDTFVARMMSPKRKERFQSTDEMITYLSSININRSGEKQICVSDIAPQYIP